LSQVLVWLLRELGLLFHILLLAILSDSMVRRTVSGHEMSYV
jgi:hypothetical protein